jgi:hypothetical protein
MASGASCCSAAAAPKVVTYPAPPAEALSGEYEVQAGGRKIDVYTARVLDPPFAGKEYDYGGSYSFANFDMAGTVVVRIVSKRSLGNTVVRPTSSGIQPVFEDDHTLNLTLDRPRKLSVEPDGKKGPLLLFANPLEIDAPKPDDKGVVFFGPGVHKPERILLQSNQTLYLAGGAVVKAEVLAEGANIRICGRGILDGSDWEWRKGPVGNLIAIRNCTDVEVNGITLRGSAHWTIVPRNSRRVTIRNVKLCNSRVQNDDGINPCNSQDVLITDCFIRSDDDCVALKGLDFTAADSNVERITVENSVLWCDRARIFLLGHESRAAFMRNVRLRNLDIIHFTMTPFLLEPGEDMRLEDVRIEDIRIHGEGQREFIRLRPVVNQYMRKKVPGFIRNIGFRNVMIEGHPGEYLVQIEGADSDHNVRDVTFENVSILDSKLTEESKQVRIGKNTENVHFYTGTGKSPESQAEARLPAAKVPDGAVCKRAMDLRDAGENLLDPNTWKPSDKGFRQEDKVFVCDNGVDSQARRGVFQTVVLDQTNPQPIVATAWSKAQDVGGSRDSDYSLYLDLTYQDGTPLWGQVGAFTVGSHGWQKTQVVVFPEKPVKAVSFYMLLRGHAGKALFRDPQLHVIKPPAGACLFDGIAISSEGAANEGFQVRDAASGTNFIAIEHSALNLTLDCNKTKADGSTFFDVTVSDTNGTDRAVTLIYSIPVASTQCRWFHDPRHTMQVELGREYLNATRFSAGATGRLSRYPFGAVANATIAVGLGIDMARPAFFRVGYNADTEELFLAYDLGLTPEKPTAHLRFCKFEFDPKWGFRGALDSYYRTFPHSFHRRIAEQGLWMPFAKISAVKNWQDFGFRFKEGTDETTWDDEHGIITFRYTEPMTWWMRMPKDMPRTIDAALAEARRLAIEGKDQQAMALLTSGFHDDKGQYSARLLDTPWCDGAVWSINSMPQVAGDVTDFKNKWNGNLREKLYGPKSTGDLDGEYIDSSEGYVTDELDFRRDHFAAAQTALTFSLKDHKPGVFRGLIAFEYARAIAQDVHAMDKLMMANATPISLCWLAPLLDIMGTETDWNPGSTWRPMSDSDLLYRRAMCKGKPYCFLMNTEFERFPHELVEKYMKRCLAYGMFPGFFSHNASKGHYFTRPELYERDRDLFKKYVPLCKLVAEAGWEPITRAYSSHKDVRVERFGDHYLTIFNDSGQQQEVTITVDADVARPVRDLLSGRDIDWHDRKAVLTLAAEDVAVLKAD